MSRFDFKNRIKRYLEPRRIDDADAVSRFVDDCSLSSFAADPESSNPHQFTQYFDLFADDLQRLTSGRFGQRPEQLLTRGMLDAIWQARRPLGDGFSLQSAGPEQSLPPFLLRCGFVTRPVGDGKLRFGYPKLGTPSLPTTFYEALYNVPPLAFWESPYVENYERFVAQGQQESAEPLDWPPPEELGRIDLTASCEMLHAYFCDVIAAAKKQSDPWFVNLQNAVDFYTRIQKLYASQAADHQVYVFSTTSGLVVKEQYLGSNDMETSQFRKPYFDFLHNSHAQIFYQFDPQTTWYGKKGIARSPLPLTEHEEHFARFLQLPNLELSELRFETPDTRWRREYTIVNSRGEVAFSSRSPEVKDISEGLIATDGFWAAEDLQPYLAVQCLYREQLPCSRTIKTIGEVLSLDEARQRATETFRRWQLDLRPAN